jgi:prolyl-tRNA synthetase
MRQTKYFLKTSKTVSEDDKIVSSKLLKQAGYIAESVAGRYYFLPIGQRVQQKIIGIVKKEMDVVGAQEMVAPILHPLELWKETNRTNTTGFELMKVKDRRDSEFALGGTAEEMFVDLVRKYQLSYKDLPFQLYQFSPKFRDELRARGGLLRVREFIMKDGYSFHRDEEDFKKTYEEMKNVYNKIFKNLGLDTDIVESDNGYIGGEYCHEFVVPSEIGETKYFSTEDGSYAAHEDVAKFVKFKIENTGEEIKERKDVEGVGMIGVEELVKFLDIPIEKTTKTIIFETDKNQVVAAAVNGIYDINETKLKHVLGCNELKLASEEVVKKVTGAEVGYAGILNLPKEVLVIMDDSLKGRINFECGANKTNYHSININFGRDLPEPDKYYDIAMVKSGCMSLSGSPLIEKRGIEVGNIFQLGYHYTKLMKGANFKDEDGSEKPYYMGCYGIGIGRTMATIVEKFSDDKGIIWPESVAPFAVHLLSLGEDPEVIQKANEVYENLIKNNIEVLFDDRAGLTAGEKFADCDLLGMPCRVVVSARSMKENGVEIKKRTEEKGKVVTETELLNLLAPKH